MQPRTLEQIYGEIDSVYKPQIDSLRSRQALVPQAVEADIKEAEGAQTRAYGDILNGARRRGTGVAFGGIPLGEQAEYSNKYFTPAVLQAQTAGRERALSLEDAILGINERRATQGRSIYENERNFAEERRRYEEQMQMEREKQSREAALARQSAGGFSPSYGGGMPTQGAQGAAGAPPPNELKQRAFSDVSQLLSRAGTRSYIEELQAISKSAAYGNSYDQAKLELIQARQPGLFSNGQLDRVRLNKMWNMYSR